MARVDSKGNQLVHIRCRIRHETADALLIFSFEREIEMWIPLSQVEEIHKDPRGEDWLLVSEWIARKRGLSINSTPFKDSDT